MSTISAEFPNVDFVFQQNTYVGCFHFLPSRTVEFTYNIYIYEESGLLGCAAVSLGEWFLTFRRHLMRSCSRIKQSKIQILKEIYSFATSATTYPSTQHRIAQDQKPHQYHSENPNSCNNTYISHIY